jgi:hypothetical protein
MPRLRHIHVPLKSLSVWREVRQLLSGEAALAGYDIDSAELTVRRRGPAPYIRDVDKVIANLVRYEANNRHLIPMFEDEQLIHKKDLARMMKISRPTLDRWIDAGFIEPSISKYTREETYQIADILTQLRAYRDK